MSNQSQRRARCRAAVVALSVCVLLGPDLSGQPAPPQAIGIVDQISGPWKLVQRNFLISRGEMVFEGQTVGVGRATSGFISILLFATNQRWEKKCSQAEPCEGTYRLSAGGARSESRKGFLAFFLDYWTPDRPLEPMLMGSRSAGDRGPAHALLERSPQGVSLKPALANVAAGQYRITIVPAPGSTSAGGAGWEGVLTVGAEARSEIAGLSTGLFILTLSSESGQTVGSNAVLLVIDATEPHLRAGWEEAQAMARTWTSPSPVTIDTWFARALYSLDAHRKRP
jgi:hypothetical protein